MIELDDNGLTIPVRLLQALTRHASDEPFRQHLSGVVVDPALGRLWATDGNRALVWQGAGKGKRPAFSLQREALEMLFAALGNKTREPVRLTWDDTQATVKLSGASFIIEIPSGLAFPPIDAVIDGTKRRGEAVHDVNPRFFADAQFVCEALESGQRIRISPDVDELGPVLVTFPYNPEWTLVAMPMKK